MEDHPARGVEALTPRLWKEHFPDDPLRSDIDRDVKNVDSRPPTNELDAASCFRTRKRINNFLVWITVIMRSAGQNTKMFKMMKYFIKENTFQTPQL